MVLSSYLAQVTKLVQPLVRSLCKRTSVWEALPEGAAGRSQFFVVHAYQAPFQAMVRQLLHRFDPPQIPGGPAKHPVDLKSVLLWLDFVSVPIIQKDFNISMVKDAVTSGCPKGMLVILDTDLIVLKR